MLKRKKLTDEQLCQFLVDSYNETQEDLIILQNLKKGAFIDYKTKLIPKKEFKEYIDFLEELSIEDNLQVLDIESQLLEKNGEEFIKKLKGGQLNG